MLKKILGALLAITLLVPMAGVVHANTLSDPLYGSPVFITNGSFNADEAGWTVSGGTIQDENGNKLYVPGEQDAKITQLITGLTPGIVYECTFSMRSSMANAAYIGVVQKNVTGDTVTDVTAAASGAAWETIVNYSFTYEPVFENWTDFRFIFSVPTGGNAVSLSFGANRGDESLAFDNISVVRAQNLINNSSLDETIPKCISNGIGTTELPFEWKTNWKDGFMVAGTGVDGTKGMSVLGDLNLEQSVWIPLQGGREYSVSYRYMVRRRFDTTSEDVVTTYLADTRAYAKFDGASGNCGNHQAAEEGVWYQGVASFKPSADGAFRLILRNNSGSKTTADLLICFDDIRVEYPKGSTTWHNHGSSDELKEFPTSGVTTLRVKRMQYNHGMSDMNARLILCIYKEVDGTKCLESFTVGGTKTIAPGSRILWNDFYVQTTMPTMEEGVTYYAEAFVWDSLQGLKSLAEKSVLR